jgi:glycosyltransferase involved in cell wall biosynthesis
VLVLAGQGTERLDGQDGPIRRYGLGVRDDIDRLLRGADVLVLPSRSEGTPNAVIEAMASGIPCVVTDVGDCRELLGPGGIVVPAESPKELADALTTMARMDPQRRSGLGEDARMHVQEHHSLGASRDAYRALWDGRS